MPHTPGPWSSSACYAGFSIRSASPYKPLAIIQVNAGVETEECRENGRLMAAAPDLLAALQGVLRVADRATIEFDAARAAITKATT